MDVESNEDGVLIECFKRIVESAVMINTFELLEAGVVPFPRNNHDILKALSSELIEHCILLKESSSVKKLVSKKLFFNFMFDLLSGGGVDIILDPTTKQCVESYLNYVYLIAQETDLNDLIKELQSLDYSSFEDPEVLHKAFMKVTSPDLKEFMSKRLSEL